MAWVVSAGAVAIVYCALQSRRKRQLLPPGPAGWPMIGNVLQWPKKERWLTWVQWANTYGKSFSRIDKYD
jgi:hypothetical protein